MRYCTGALVFGLILQQKIIVANEMNRQIHTRNSVYKAPAADCAIGGTPLAARAPAVVAVRAWRAARRLALWSRPRRALPGKGGCGCGGGCRWSARFLVRL